jgi:hypothetical protein
MRCGVALASVVAVVGLAVPAHADPDPDASFLAALNDAGITYRSGPDAVAIGRRACQLLDQGHPEPDVVKSMAEQNAGFSVDAAKKFTRLAESTYCPQHVGGAEPPPQPTPQPYYPAPFFPLPAAPGAL